MNPDRLRQTMTAQGLSQAELARRAGVSAATVQQLLNGSIKTTKALRAIATALEVSADWLEGIQSASPIVGVDLVTQEGDREITTLPYLGVFTENSSGQIHIGVKPLKVSSYWFKESVVKGKEGSFSLAQIRTSEMAPTFIKGDDVCYMHSRVHDGDPDGIWWFDYRNVHIIRRVRPIGDNIYMISADNPAFAPFEATGDQLSFGGKVVWHGRSLVT